MSYQLFVGSTNSSGFRKYSCEFRKFAYFWSNFERCKDLGICLWNPKQPRRSNKSSNVADSATNLILACCGFRIQCRLCTVWSRYVRNRAKVFKRSIFGFLLRFWKKLIVKRAATERLFMQRGIRENYKHALFSRLKEVVSISTKTYWSSKCSLVQNVCCSYSSWCFTK